ncbi:unnamed protein product [Strongylus vulgaris]|uniref:Uncharacterized protein n=1 Tax=Strongylus vulgaris TaxID=40348 RepID=A0A3P7KUH7_STRVU|nr:unnamed protein product [Strongylus vulgaris]
MRPMSHLRDPAEYISKAKHRRAGYIVRRRDDKWTLRALLGISRKAKRPRERLPTGWADVFMARMDQLNQALARGLR